MVEGVLIGGEKLIPKVIHYVWLGKKEKNKVHEKVLKSWKKRAPEYEIVEWNENNIPHIDNKFFNDALRNEKYAFASDFIRMYVLEKYGGVYMDLDMLLLKDPTEVLDGLDLAFSIQDKNVIFQTSFIAANPHNSFIKQCLELYDTLKFDSSELKANSELLTPLLLRNYPFQKKDETQIINGACAYNSEILLQPSFNSVAVHIGETSWKENTSHDKLRIMLRQYITNQFEAGIFKFVQDIARKIL